MYKNICCELTSLPPRPPKRGVLFKKTIFNSFSLLILVWAMWFWAQNNRNYIGQMSSKNMWPFGNFRGRRKQNIENIVKKSERGFQMLWLPPHLFSYYLFYPLIILYNISDLRAFFPRNLIYYYPNRSPCKRTAYVQPPIYRARGARIPRWTGWTHRQINHDH